MASSNDSQGLKIAVAVLVALTVMLLVGTYFAYSEYDKAATNLVAAKKEAADKASAAAAALRDFQALRDRAGYSDVASSADVLKKITDDQDATVKKLSELDAELNEAVAEAQKAGATEAEIEQLRGDIRQLAQRYADESTQSPTLKSSLDTAIDIAANQARLAMAFMVDDAKLRDSLSGVNSVNKAELDVQTEAVSAANNKLNTEIAKYEEIRAEQAVRLDNLQTANVQLQAQLDAATAALEKATDTYKTDLTELTTQLGDLREQSERSEIVLDVPDGEIEYVDFSRNEVLVNVTRRQGAKPQLMLTLFDADSPGLPTDKPKGKIQLIQVGEKQSIGKIVDIFDAKNPVRAGDLVYSAAWSPNEPQQFALIGKIDMNRDGRDDREDLRRLIEAAGGTVTYDLPPHGEGPESGELSALIAWYVRDELEPIRTPGNRDEIERLSQEEQASVKDESDAIERARSLGIRLLPIQRLLSSLGYKPGMVMPGRVEAQNLSAIRDILNPSGIRGALPGSEEFERKRQGRQEAAGEEPTPAGTP